MLLTFPEGKKVKVEFDDTAHTYVVAHKLDDGKFTDWKPTHGVTTPLDVVPKPYLKPWASKLAAEAAVEFFLNNPGTDLSSFFEDYEAMNENQRTEDDKPVMSYYRFYKKYPWFKEIKAAYRNASDDGKELGSWIHSAIEEYYKSDRKETPIITEATEGMWESFKQFDNFYKPKPDDDGIEFLVYSMMFGFSGQGDFRGYMANKHVIADWKSTNRSRANPDGISIDYFYQLGGLAQAEFERTGEWVEDLCAVNIDKKGEEPRVRWASDFGMSPKDAARAYISCFNNHHMHKHWKYKYKVN